jgi:hypothetical protein
MLIQIFEERRSMSAETKVFSGIQRASNDGYQSDDDSLSVSLTVEYHSKHKSSWEDVDRSVSLLPQRLRK